MVAVGFPCGVLLPIAGDRGHGKKKGGQRCCYWTLPLPARTKRLETGKVLRKKTSAAQKKTLLSSGEGCCYWTLCICCKRSYR